MYNDLFLITYENVFETTMQLINYLQGTNERTATMVTPEKYY